MKSLYESLFDIDDNIENVDESIKKSISKFILNNYDLNGDINISDSPNNNGKYVVDCDGGVHINIAGGKNKSLTNGMFVWGVIKGCFDCNDSQIISLEGAPEKTEDYFDCSYCFHLKTLKGAPKKVGERFICSGSKKQFTEEDVMKSVDVNRNKIYI